MKNNSNKGIQNNKHYLSRSVRWIVFIFIVGIGGYLALPSNYYLRRVLTHLLPKIDQYPIFENRVVQAGSPHPWELSEAYNTKSIPEHYLPRFEELGTVAYVIIQDNRLLFEQYWEDYSPKSHSDSFSMAKSIVSLAIGCVINDGFIRYVDQPVSDFFGNSRDTTEKPIVASTVTPVISPASDNYYSTKDKNLFIKRSKNKRT